jgi:hypothetical protein
MEEENLPSTECDWKRCLRLCPSIVVMPGRPPWKRVFAGLLAVSEAKGARE